jgi:hypothetical protein
MQNVTILKLFYVEFRLMIYHATHVFETYLGRLPLEKNFPLRSWYGLR